MKPLVFVLTLLFSFSGIPAVAQQAVPRVPLVHSSIAVDEDGRLFVQWDGRRYYDFERPNRLTLEQLKGTVHGTDVGLHFSFGNPSLAGSLFFGFIPYGESKHPSPVYFGLASPIRDGEASIDIKNQLAGMYDLVGWQKSGRGTIGYRVSHESGRLLYDGRVSFRGTGPFEVDLTVTEGPFVNRVGPDGATISFETNFAIVATVEVNGQRFADPTPTRRHEIPITGLRPNQEYTYRIEYDDNELEFSFRTAPEPGSRHPFTFSYASDSRSGQGGGERNLYGTNYYMMRRIMAVSALHNVAFTQFTGDLISGNLDNKGEMNLQYANWKKAVEPFAHYFPVYVSMGNHEALVRFFVSDGAHSTLSIDRFPFVTESAEAVFADNFVNPDNGPESEDGAVYDPNMTSLDFPPYAESVFYYTYDNVAMIVLNSDYWFAPSIATVPITSGGVHGYIMDKQMEWLDETVTAFEIDENIDHIFVTCHVPFFPNGGHVADAMWFHGDNAVRPYVAGRPVSKGILERRDQLLDIIVNRSAKVVAILTGDEHNYSFLEITPHTDIYPDGYRGEKITLFRTVYQVNNGAAGAPYYAQEQVPWTPHVSAFTTQNAVVLFHVNGENVDMEVINPDTLEEVHRRKLR